MLGKPNLNCNSFNVDDIACRLYNNVKESALIYTQHRDIHAVGLVFLQMLLGLRVMEQYPDAQTALHRCRNPPLFRTFSPIHYCSFDLPATSEAYYEYAAAPEETTDQLHDFTQCFGATQSNAQPHNPSSR